MGKILKGHKKINSLNESYNFPPYILAASSHNKIKASTNFSFIQRENASQIVFQKDVYHLNRRSPNKGTFDAKKVIFSWQKTNESNKRYSFK